MTEREYIRDVLGQPDPGPMLDYDHATATSQPISQEEQDVLFPGGLDDPAHQGGLQRLAMGSRVNDAINSSASAYDPATAQAQNQTAPAQPQNTAPGYQGQKRTMATGAPDAWARAEKANRQMGASSSLAHSGGVLVRLIASAAAGGAAGGAGGGAGGAGGGGAFMGETGAADAGTAAGAESGAGFGADAGGGFSADAGAADGGVGAGGGGSFGQDFMSGFKGQGGGGWGGQLGQMARKKALSSLQSGGGGGGGGVGGGGGMGGDKQQSILNAIEGIGGFGAKRRATLERLGFGPYGEGLTTEGDSSIDWFGGGA